MLERNPLTSIVVPVFNEAETIQTLHKRIVEVFRCMNSSYEVIFVDDGSTDGSLEAIRQLCRIDLNTRFIAFARNYGKATALDAGFRSARGEIIITMDADLQDDPEEIPHFLEKIDEGFELISGWKSVRHDPWHKTLPSRIFNSVVAKLSGLRLHDFNCGFKAYRRRVIENLSLYGELHRYIPLMAHNAGARIAELKVKHHARMHGRSKYGWERLPKGFLDLITIMVTTRYLKRPLHFFGGIGLISFFFGAVILTYLAILWILGKGPIGNRPLLLYGILLAIMGVQLFSTGVMAELMVYFAQRNALPLIKETSGLNNEYTRDVKVEPPSEKNSI